MSNPWITIWTKPRATIRQIVDVNPNCCLWGLAFIYGFCSLMNFAQSSMLGYSMGSAAILILSFVLAPFWGYMSFSIWSGIVFWVGKLFKGQGNFAEVRAAYSWSCVPIAINIPLWLLMVVLYGHQLFLNHPDSQLMSGAEIFILFSILIAKVILAVWSLVIYLNGLAEVQKMSMVRVIFNVIVSGLILSFILFGLWVLILYLFGSGSQLSATNFLFDGNFETMRKVL